MSVELSEPVVEVDDARLVRRATGLLGAFNRAGVLGPADVHTARRVARMCGEADEQVQLALALAVRALRVGSVAVDLRTVADTVFDDSEQQIDTASLPWPPIDRWLQAVQASPAVSVGPDGPPGRPLRFAFGLLYLERYWRQEETVRIQLRERAAAPRPVVDLPRLARGLSRIFDRNELPPGEPDRQRQAAAVSVLSWVSVLAGGPGTGKTTTVANLLALLRDQTADPVSGPNAEPEGAPLTQPQAGRSRTSGRRVALAAPTGKAAARLEEAVRAAGERLPAEDRDQLPELHASTLHRLLGWRADNKSRFRHDADNHLPYDVVVVDEMSMVSLTLMARLLEAVRPDARLILVGDPDQLSSVEAGAVLADITGAPGRPDPTLAAQLAEIDELTWAQGAGQTAGQTDGQTDGERSEPDASVVHGVVRLQHTWRYGGVIDELARAIRSSEDDRVIEILRRGDPALAFTETTGDQIDPGQLAALRDQVVAAGRETAQAAVAGDAVAALSGLDRHRLLCGHRRGPFGVTRWTREAEHWLSESVPGYGLGGEWYAGRPLLITANDYDMNLYNGDTGVVIETESGSRAAFARGGTPELIAPVRLDNVQTVHAMTVHRAQGSQFEAVSFIVPPPDSPLLTRELLYTAVTRATERVGVFGTEEAIRRAVLRPANRASGLRNRLAD